MVWSRVGTAAQADRMRKLTLTVALAAMATVASAAPAGAVVHHPSTYVISYDPGVVPEGIAVTGDGTMYVTSSATGAVYRGDTAHATMRTFLPAGSDGRHSAAGIHLDRYGRIFIAGLSDTLYVYSRTGTLLAKRATGDAGSYLNDLVITEDAVYVTDTLTRTVYRAAITCDTVGELTAWITPSAFPATPGYLNGIVASGDGRLALVADQGDNSIGSERLYRVDLVARAVTDVGGTDGLFGADGMLLDGSHLYGVVNFPDAAGTYVFATRELRLNADWTAATVIGQSATVPLEVTPSTIARDGDRLLWVNSQIFAGTPTVPWVVTEVPGLR
jgi:hypothetical protein